LSIGTFFIFSHTVNYSSVIVFIDPYLVIICHLFSSLHELWFSFLTMSTPWE